MYNEILPPCTHAQKEITFSNASFMHIEQFYMGCNTCIGTGVSPRVHELKEW